MPIITVLTDFGSRDSYVAEVKGVLLAGAPAATLVDVTHDVPPGAVMTAQFLLSRVWARFPAGTVHLAVVDPGVGTGRRALAAEAAGQRFVAPDNGLLTMLPHGARFVALAVPAASAHTFHGRDLFAPAAARLATGASLEDLGLPVADPIRSPLPAPRRRGDETVGVVLHVDHFGNLITNLPAPEFPAGATVEVRVDGSLVGVLSPTFGAVAPGELLAYVGSGGTVEIAVRDGNAARRLGVGIGAAAAVGHAPPGRGAGVGGPSYPL